MMLTPLLDALGTIFTIEAMAVILLGATIGIAMGAIPGMGGSITLAILIPLSLAFESETALLLMIGALGGVNYGGSIPAILLKIPGTAPSIMTTIDGYKMTENNEGTDALGASAAASAMGAIIGAVALLLIIPFLDTILLTFGPPEFLLVAIIGMLTIAAVLQGSLLNGLISICVGVALSFHGLSSITGVPRFSFDRVYLLDGISVVIVIVGLFAISEMIVFGGAKQTIADNPANISGSPINGIRETIKHRWLVVRGSLIGIAIGIIPAVGATVSTLVAYAHAKNLSPDPSSFGKGNIEGVIAPESSNDAKDGAALLPTLAFAIPGSPSHVVLLGALVLHGVTPGPTLLSENASIIYLFIFGLIVANIYTSSVGLLGIKYFVKVARVPSRVLVPLIVVLSLYGSYAFRTRPIDMLVVMLIGLFGYWALKSDVGVIPLVFGLILGPIIETTYTQSMQITDGSWGSFFTRPGTVGILVFIVLLITAFKAIEWKFGSTPA